VSVVESVLIVSSLVVLVLSVVVLVSAFVDRARAGNAAGRDRVAAKRHASLLAAAEAAVVQIQVSPRLYDEWLYASGRVARGKLLDGVPGVAEFLEKRPGDEGELRLVVERLFMLRLLQGLYGAVEFPVDRLDGVTVSPGRSFGQMLNTERERRNAQARKLPS
jgi:hypothetical protein